MATNYLGEIRIFAGSFAPDGWALCDGSLLIIEENVALFQLLGTIFGGDGVNDFGLPDLQGLSPLLSPDHPIGQKGSTEKLFG